MQPKSTHHLTFEQLMADEDADDASDAESDAEGAGARGQRSKQPAKVNKKKADSGRSVYLEDDAEVRQEGRWWWW